MRGDDLPAIIAEWIRLAEQDSNRAMPTTYAGLALVFAELTKGLVLWQKALENWNMRESQIILGWKNEGKTDEDVLRLLQIRFHLEVPPDLRLAVEGTNDLDTLARWFDRAVTASSLDEFRAAMT